MNIAIFGINGAIGSQFEKQYSGNNRNIIYSFGRSNPKNLNNFYYVDIENETSIKEAANLTKDVIFNRIIIATGILHDQNIQPEKTIKSLDADVMAKIFAINTFGPMLIMKYFSNNLDKFNPSVMAALSARVGSINDNSLGGWYSYRASKAALNMAIKTTAIEITRTHKFASVIGLHPGSVQSNLSAPFLGNIPSEKLFSPEYSVSKLIEIIENIGPEFSGKCIDYNGFVIEP